VTICGLGEQTQLKLTPGAALTPAPVALGAPIRGEGSRLAFDLDDFVFREPSARLAKKLPLTVSQFAEIQPLPFAAGARPPAQKTRRQHSRIVQDEQIAGGQQLGQLEENVVRNSRTRTVEYEEPCLIARGSRLLSNQVCRQFVIEKAGVSDSM